MFERIDSVAQRRTKHCVRSPNVVSPMLRGAKSVTETWMHTTAHTITVHLLGRTEMDPTLRVYVYVARAKCYGSNLTNVPNVLLGRRFDRSIESLNKPENITIRVVKRHRRDTECIRLSPVTRNSFLHKPFAQCVPVFRNPD